MRSLARRSAGVAAQQGLAVHAPSQKVHFAASSAAAAASGVGASSRAALEESAPLLHRRPQRDLGTRSQHERKRRGFNSAAAASVRCFSSSSQNQPQEAVSGDVSAGPEQEALGNDSIQKVAQLLASGRFREALTLLDALEKAHPDNEQVLRTRAFALVQRAMTAGHMKGQTVPEGVSVDEFRQAMLGEALRLYERVEHVGLADIVVMAQAVVALGNVEGTGELLDKAIELAPHDNTGQAAEILLAAVGTIFRVPQLMESHGIRLVDAVLALGENNVRALGAKALIHGYMNQNTEALEAADRGLGLNSRDPHCLLARSIAHSNLQQHHDACEMARQVLTCQDAPPEIQSQALAVLGVSGVARAGQEGGGGDSALEEAAGHLERAAMLMPTNDVAAIQLAGLYFKLQRPIHAILKPLNSLLDLIPNHLAALTTKAEVVARFGSTDEALNVLDTIYGFYPQHVPALQIKFLLLYRANRDHEALATVDQALEIAEPAETNIPLQVAKAMPLIRLGFNRDARDLLDSAAARVDVSNPTHHTTICNLALMYAELGETTIAEDWVARVLANDSEHVLANISKVWMSAEPLDKSYWAQRALSAHPDNPAAMWELGVALEHLGFPKEGQEKQMSAGSKQAGVTFAFAKQGESREPQEMLTPPDHAEGKEEE